MPHYAIKRIIIYGIGFVCLLGVFIVTVFGLFLVMPAEKGANKQVVVVEEGLNLGEVAEKLRQRDIIASKTLFMAWARVTGTGRRLKSGEYRIGPGMSPVRILETLTRGTIMTHPVTIPEGFTRFQVAQVLEEEGLVKKGRFTVLSADPTPLKAYGISSPSLEGYLYPDTYHFGRDTSPRKVIETMLKRFWEVVGPLKTRADEIGMKMDQLITLASIVEKETGQGRERPIIASVFLNRLKRGMRLDSDPTVIYGLVAFNGNLTKKDLARSTPYNTYVHRGLPPGPIANPGIASIKAVLYPAKTDYLYFVSKNDGTHHFSKTLSEHNRAVAKYQKMRRRNRKKNS